MQPNDSPLVCLPVGLSDEAAAQVLEFLHSLTEAFEQRYAGQCAGQLRTASFAVTTTPPSSNRPSALPGPRSLIRHSESATLKYR